MCELGAGPGRAQLLRQTVARVAGPIPPASDSRLARGGAHLEMAECWSDGKGVQTAVEEGSPRGEVISPLLANIYLHYVIDLWLQAWRKNLRAPV